MSRKQSYQDTFHTDHEYGNYVLKMFDKVDPVFYREFLNKIGLKNIENYIRREKLKNINKD